MSKDKFVKTVITRLHSEYGVSLDNLEKHVAAIESAHATESGATEDEMDALFSGRDSIITEELAKKYPLLNQVSLEVVAELDDEEEEGEDEDDDDDDDDEEDSDDEDEDDDE